MKASRSRRPLTAALFAAAIGLAVLPGAEAGMPDTTSSMMSSSMHVSEPVEAVLTGRNICLSCYLKSRFGAHAACARTGHRHALKVSTARTKGGAALADAEGWVLHYLVDASSEALVTDHHGETVTVTGRLYPHERALEVRGFKMTMSK